MPTKENYELEGFLGAVTLQEWMNWIDNRVYKVIAGRITIMSDEKMLGFKVRGANQANWLARIEGDGVALNIPGCQIRGVAALDNLPTNPDILIL